MKRAWLGLGLALLATAAAFVAFWLRQGIDEGARPIAFGVAAGGSLGAFLAAAGAGAQIALVARRPGSQASFAAMVAGFFAKALVLVAGFLLLRRPGSAADPVAFAVSLLLASAIVSAFALSTLLPRR